MSSNLFIPALAILVSLSCTSQERESTRSGIATIAVANSKTQPIAAKSMSANRVIDETGVLKQIDDSGYPMAILTIEFPDRKFSEDFTINLEEVEGTDLSTLSGWIGKKVSFSYGSELVNALLDIQVAGKSLLKDNDVPIEADTKKIAGILKGADEETQGDLPATIAITSVNKLTQSFPFFVTKELVAANGSAVVGFYEERTENKIMSIKLASK